MPGNGKIDKKMREEIIPEMLKNVSSMRNMRFGFEENEDENDDKNPDWADAFEQSGLGDKLRERMSATWKEPTYI